MQQVRQTVLLPYELLIRWDDEGNLKGAHLLRMGKVLDDVGNVIAAQPMPPQPIAVGEEGFPLAEVMNQALIDALKQIAILENQVESLNNVLATQATIHQTQIDQLRAQLNL